jgi:hypothetical protein
MVAIMGKPKIEWFSPNQVGARAYDCGHCGKHTGPNQGYYGTYTDATGQGRTAFVMICTFCTELTYWDLDGRQIPGVPAGQPVKSLPPTVDRLYNEARRAAAAAAPTAAVMALRKVLMNVAVDQGAKENLKFVQYVGWLDDNNYIPPNGRGWVEKIKDIGNEANHEIPDISEDDAARVLRFTQMLLMFVYELPGEVAEPTDEEAEAAQAG